MTRNKAATHPKASEIISNQKTREAQRKAAEFLSLPVRPPPKTTTGVEVAPPPLPPKVSFSEMKRILQQNKRGWVEAALVPLPAGEDDDLSPHPGFTQIRELPSEDYDPVIKKWNMYMNVRPDKHVMLLRYPERMPGQLYLARNGQKPLEMRIKTAYRLVEVDIPLDPHNPSYDKVRGVIYGEAMRKSKILQEKGGSYGVAGGFGLGGPTQSRAAARAAQAAEGDEPTVEALLEDYDNAVKNGHVMTKMTLGGHIVQWQEGYSNLFVGAFTRDDVFFTKVDAMVVLRPQLIHLDALNDQKKSTIRMQAGADTEENEASYVNMQVKDAEGETMESAGDAGEIAKLLKAMRAEPWQRLGWVDSETKESFDKFHEVFFNDKKDMPDLVCNMTNEQWLDSFSAPRIDPINSTKRYMTTLTGDDDLSSTDSEGEYAYYSEGDGEKGIGEDGEDVESEKEVEDEAGSGAAV